MKKNRLKTSSEEKTQSKTKKSEKKGFGKKISLKGKFAKAGDIAKNEKSRQIIGLLFILFSAYLLIAFTSFLFTWKIDQSKVELPFSDYFFDSSILVENWLGKLGAAVSHQFIYDWFGIASFLFVGLFFLIGFKILFKISLLPLARSFRVSGFFLLWLALFFGYFFKAQLYYLGGGIGYEMNQFLRSVLGGVGTGIFIFFILAVFLIISMNIGEYFKIF